MNLTENIKNQILEHAKEESPKESCGLLAVKKGRVVYKKCKNIADLPKECFVLASDDYIKAEEEGEIVAVAHSHTFQPPIPSDGDKVACEKSGVPWFIVNPQTEKWGYCEPSGFELPYVGRKFQFGIIDYYSLVRDYFKKELDLQLRDYYRCDNFWEKGQSLYEDNFMKEGFVKIPVDEIRKHDLLFMHLAANLPNHAAIYVGDQQVLHHVQGRLSSRDILGEYYMKNIAFAARHKTLL